MEDITIPKGYDAKIEGDKIVFVKKESEDERIREAIESIIRVYGKTQGGWIAGYDMDTLVVRLRDTFACLERQKEQAPEIPDTKAFQEGVKEGRRLEREEHKSYEGEPMEIRYAKRVYKVHGTRVFPGGGIGYIIEDEPGHYDCIVNPDEVLGGGYGIKGGGSPYPTNDIAFSEQPAEWREEDEHYFQNLIMAVDSTFSEGYTKDWLQNRFKSLRPQPKQELSDEEKNKLNRIYLLIRSATAKGNRPLIGDNEANELQGFLTHLSEKFK